MSPTALRTILFTILVPGTVTIWLPLLWLRSGWDPLRFSPGLARAAGFVLLVAGALVYAACAWEFTFVGRGTPAPIDPPRELVVSGLYRHVRNPIYVGVVAVLFGEGLIFGSGSLLLYAIALLAGFHLRVVYAEEPGLRRRFGASFDRYCETVPRWIPRRTTGAHAGPQPGGNA